MDVFSRRVVRMVVGLAVACLLPVPVFGQESWGAAMARSRVLEEQGRPAAAAAVLEPLRARYPQDAALFLRLGWLHFNATSYDRALERYEQALALAPDSTEALLGRAWTRLRMGDRDAARTDFLAVLTRQPDSTSAQEGEQLTRAWTTFSPTMTGLVHAYRNHPEKERAWGLVLSLPVQVRERFLAGAAWRLTQFASRRGNGAPRRWSNGTTFVQQEGWGYAGLAWPRAAAALHYGYADGGGASNEAVHIAGLTGRLTLWGDLLVSGSASLYDGLEAYRATGAWKLPVTDWLAVQPGGAWQSVDGESLGAGYLDVTLQAGPVRLTAGGKWGREKRPAYLDQSVVYNTADEIRYGIGAGIAVTPATGITLSAGYDFQRLRTPAAGDDIESDLHLGIFSLTWTGGYQSP